MNQRMLVSTVITASACALAVTSCNAQVLAFGDGGVGSALDIPSSTTIEALTDTQAATLCNWLIEEFPDPNKMVPPVDNPECGSSVPGHVSGRMIGCEMGSPNNMSEFNWALLDVSDCTANLRHSPCDATIGSLQQCVAAARQAWPQDFCAAAGGCAAYWSHSACTETVFQAHEVVTETDVCSGCLPIQSGVTCPSGGADSGAGVDGGTEGSSH